jgi:ubiquinone/menaquinone biosynthesis C-methylase UbiE
MTATINNAAASYALGDTEHERRRLQQQSDLIGGFTRHVFEQAGIAPGMKVLDVGSGAGDVALLLAGMVGPDGRVVGIDRNPAILSTAKQRIAAAGHTNVDLVAGDISNPDVVLDPDFDAAVGRLVLMYNPDTAATLSAISERVRPGGIVAFQEADFTFFGHSVPSTPLMTNVHDWISGAFAAGGSDPQVGFKLPQLFARAGLPRPHLQFNTYMGSGPEFRGYEFAAATLRSLLPMIERSGIATVAEIDIDTLADRLRAEATAADATIATVSLIAAWTRLLDS